MEYEDDNGEESEPGREEPTNEDVRQGNKFNPSDLNAEDKGEFNEPMENPNKLHHVHDFNGD